MWQRPTPSAHFLDGSTPVDNSGSFVSVLFRSCWSTLGRDWIFGGLSTRRNHMRVVGRSTMPCMKERSALKKATRFSRDPQFRTSSMKGTRNSRFMLFNGLIHALEATRMYPSLPDPSKKMPDFYQTAATQAVKRDQGVPDR